MGGFIPNSLVKIRGIHLKGDRAMPMYTVTLHETLEYVLEIEAPSKSEAEDKACMDWAKQRSPEDFYISTGLGVEVVYIEEIE
jgi:hypothetical protein